MNNSREKTPLPTHLARIFGPGSLAGIRLGDWLRLLAENGFQINPRYWGRAAHVTLSGFLGSPLSRIEDLFYGSMPESSPSDPPLFVLGSWRSGTTHLHNLLCQDERFAAPDLFQTMYPRTFRVARWWWEPILAVLTPQKRFMDNVKMSLQEPAEDEMAIGILCRKSNSFSWIFPRNAKKYDNYLSFEQAGEDDRIAFEKALRYFVAKVQQVAGHPLILKSPNHTARIELILRVFPEAKFLHIHRNPFEVFQSFVHMARRVIPIWALQKTEDSEIENMVLNQYRELYQAYFRQRDAIPPSQLYELSYEKLVSDPLNEIQQAYKHLQLPDFEQTRENLESYLNSNQNYRRNQHVEIPQDVQKRILKNWGFCFDQWGYPKDITLSNPA